MNFSFPQVREHFPALAITDGGRPRVYLDNPAGTQVPQAVVQAMSEYLIQTNANHDGHFRTSRQSDEILEAAHQGMADFLNAGSSSEIIFGPNMTTLTYAISRSLAKSFRPGDAILLTRMDHDANVWPWVQVAEDHDLEIRWLEFDRETFEFNLQEMEHLLDGRLRLAAFCYASNALGTINDAARMVEIARSAGALTYVDAVQYAPHGPTDVQALGCDFLVCSAYKFFGPHQGILWGRKELLEELHAYKVRPADASPPGKFETGTQSHEGQAGTLAAIRYLASIGREVLEQKVLADQGAPDQAACLRAAMNAIKKYEVSLGRRLISGLQQIPGVTIFGITEESALERRVPTIAFRLAGHHPAAIAKTLAEKNIFVWDGDYYAVEVIKALGFESSGGMVRVGAVHYNTIDEIDACVEAVAQIARA